MQGCGGGFVRRWCVPGVEGGGVRGSGVGVQGSGSKVRMLGFMC